MRIIRWCVLCCFVLTQSLLAELGFLRKDVVIDEFPEAIVTGDFNGDGRVDLAVGAQRGVFIAPNEGGGNFGRPIHTEAARGTFWLSPSADFNGDGLDDLIGSGFLYLSRGDGSFLPGRYLGVQEAVAAADFNDDVKTDLLISNDRRGEGVRVFLGNGDGTFQPGAYVTTTPMIQVQVADFNGDGREDVATVLLEASDQGPGTSFLVFLGQGDGTFGPETRTEVFGPAFVTDFNGDGLPDLLEGIWHGDFTIMLGNGDGSFQSPIPYENRVPGFAVGAADFTADGYADLIIVMGGTRFYLCPGKGDGTFSEPVEQSMNLSYGSGALTTADVDGDGRLDLVTLNADLSTVSILMSRAEWGPELRRAVSAANDTAIVAPESLATLFAPTGVTASESVSPPWPTSLGGISLEVRDSTGVVRLAPLLFVSPTQINFQVPAGTALGEVTLAIADGGDATVAGSTQVDSVAPGLLKVEGTTIPAATGVMVEPDGSQVSVPVFTCVPWPGGLAEFFCDFEAIPLSTAGDRPIYLSFFGTGFRGANTDNVTCSIGGVQVPVQYAGPQETPGVDQINIQLLPEVLEVVDDFWFWEALVTIRVDGVPANAVWISVD